MTNDLTNLKDEINALRTNEKSLRTSLSTLLASQTTSGLRDSVAALEARHVELTSRLKSLKAGTVAPVDKEAKETIKNNLACWESIAQKRKKIRDNIWGLIKDALPEDVNAQELKVCMMTVGYWCCVVMRKMGKNCPMLVF